MTIEKKVSLAAGLAVISVGTSVFAAGDPPADGPAIYPGYELVWQDEFDVDGGPDPEKWGFGPEGFIRNHEHQWYQDDNAFVRDGCLVIEARKESRPNPNYLPGSKSWKTNRRTIEYTSSLVSTRGKHQWTFGRFEIRAKIEAQPGLWPAIWTLGSARKWPGCGEIDIMEYYRGKLMANAAWSKQGNVPWASRWDSSKTPIEQLGDPSGWDDRFHVWRMDWDRDFIRLFVDGQLLNEIDLSKTFNETGDRANPFHEPHYLLLNLALGGDNADNPAETDTEFPSQFLIDYVRIYQAIPNE